MGNRLNGKLIISLTVVFLLILPAISYAQKQRIKVVVRNASIRMQPNVDSEVVLDLPVGSTFEVEKKLGDWYEVKFTSDIGVLITGYIHNMFVEVIEEQPEPEREVVPQPVKPEVQPKAVRSRPLAAPQTRFNIAIGGLFSSAYLISDHTHSRPTSLLEDLYVYDTFESPEAFGFNAGVGFFVTPRIELTASVATMSGTPWWSLELWLPSFDFFSSDELEYYEYDTVDTDTISTAPTFKKNMLSFGLNIYLIKKSSLGVYVGGGGTLIKATLDLVSVIEYTHTWYPVIEDHDVTIDSVTFEKTEVSAFGAHFRGGVDYKVGRNISLYAEGRYIAAKKDQEYPLAIDPDETLKLDLGGGQAILGIKFHF
ncbi:MAG: porin family protein [Candidatus Aminicenantes bacterium]|nr:porin family protein [Candidatus Aminicenantes bacterium]